MLNTNRTAAVGVTRIKLRIHCRRAKPTGDRKLRMPMTKCASASGEHAKDAGAMAYSFCTVTMVPRYEVRGEIK